MPGFERRPGHPSEEEVYELDASVVDLTDLVDMLVPEQRPNPARGPEARSVAKRGKRAVDSPSPRQRRRQRQRAAQPLEDGAFFDPARSDFASLVKKLDGVVDDD